MQVTKSVPPLHEAQLATHFDPQVAMLPVHSPLSAGLVASGAEPSTAPAKWSKSSAHPVDTRAVQTRAHAGRTSAS
jgi:hypothetical protein